MKQSKLVQQLSGLVNSFLYSWLSLKDVYNCKSYCGNRTTL